MLLDVHAHIGRIFPDRSKFLDVTDLIRKMDAWSIDSSCVLGQLDGDPKLFARVRSGDAIRLEAVGEEKKAD